MVPLSGAKLIESRHKRGNKHPRINSLFQGQERSKNGNKGAPKVACSPRALRKNLRSQPKRKPSSVEEKKAQSRMRAPATALTATKGATGVVENALGGVDMADWVRAQVIAES